LASETGDRSSSGQLSELSLRVSWMQEVLRRYRRRATIRNILAATVLLLLTATTACWLFLPESIRPLSSGLLLFATAIVFGSLVFASTRRIPTDDERVFLDLPLERRLTLADLELRYSRLRESRRSHPASASLDHESLYEDEIPFYVEELRARGVRSRRANNSVQVITIVGSLAATGIGGVALSIEALQWAGPALTFIVGTASGVAAIYKFKDRSFYAQQTANAISQEVSEYQLRIGKYRSSLGSQEMLRAMFLEEVHRLRTEQENREQNLDQPSQKSTEGE